MFQIVPLLFSLWSGVAPAAAQISEGDTVTFSRGALLLCDDAHIDNWYTFRDSFLKYDASVTFFISHFHELDSGRLAKLKILRGDGHEIAYHTLTHPWLDSSYTGKKLREFLKTEIDSGIALMREAGFEVKSFAFPGGYFTEEAADSVRQRFKAIRTFNYGFWEYWERRRNYTLSFSDSSSHFVPYGIDHNSGFFSEEGWQLMLDDLKQGIPVGLLFHKIDAEWEYGTDAEDLMRVIRDIHKAEIPFLTVGEFFGY